MVQAGSQREERSSEGTKVLGAEREVPRQSRQERVRAMRRLSALFEGNDPRAEVRRLKAEDVAGSRSA
jgi:hypothetical protein